MNLETQSDLFWHGSGRDHDKSWRQEPAGRRIINSGVVETLDMGMCRGNGEGRAVSMGCGLPSGYLT